MTDTTLNSFLAQGTAAQRAAFVPSIPTPAAGPSFSYFWYETDTGKLYVYDQVAAGWALVGTGGSGYSLVTSHTFASPETSLDVDITGYNDVMLIGRNINTSSNTLFTAQFSTDGTTFFSTSGDYVNFGSSGLEANATYIPFHATTRLGLHTILMTLPNIGLNGAPKVAVDTQDSGLYMFVANNSPVVKVRVSTSAGATLSSGDLYVLGR